MGLGQGAETRAFFGVGECVAAAAREYQQLPSYMTKAPSITPTMDCCWVGAGPNINHCFGMLLQYLIPYRSL